MITINEVGRHSFPTIDFKFQNTGDTTAVLWQFGIEVLEVTIDPTPDLEFYFSVDDFSSARLVSTDRGDFKRVNDLEVSAINNGWGTARNCDVILEESSLNQLFTEEQRRFIGDIDSGKRKSIIRLTSEQLHQAKFKKLYHRLRENIGEPENWARDRYQGFRRESLRFDSRLSETEDTNNKILPTIPIGELNLKWKCRDENNVEKQGAGTADGPGHYRELYITPNGFICDAHHVCASAMPSDTTYCTIIDPSLAAHERTYSISRMIPPRDVERFHILVGASKSCSLRLRFKFSVDKTTVITSEEFNIQIWNPRGSRLNYLYKDGEELKRREAELTSEARLSSEDRWELDDLKRDQNSQEGGPEYPFLNPDIQGRFRRRY